MNSSVATLPTVAYPEIRRLVTTDGTLKHDVCTGTLQSALSRLTGHVSSIAKSSPLVLESRSGTIMSVHYERRFGFLVSLCEPGDIMATVLVDTDLPEDDVVCETPRRPVNFTRRSFVSERHAWRALEHFAQSGERCPDSHWIEP